MSTGQSPTPGTIDTNEIPSIEELVCALVKSIHSSTPPSCSVGELLAKLQETYNEEYKFSCEDENYGAKIVFSRLGIPHVEARNLSTGEQWKIELTTLAKAAYLAVKTMPDTHQISCSINPEAESEEGKTTHQICISISKIVGRIIKAKMASRDGLTIEDQQIVINLGYFSRRVHQILVDEEATSYIFTTKKIPQAAI